ncbi:GMC family oxidoreductase N-terminal domain-containing protein [Deinococcus petrolearius]|uniref:GMC family oxidoreductase N-terminal domain-containing protein n=1 Tax=Deinococcus petrolearius TaxID=1751295 RepID=A0ABW1DF59_9DEIO
MSHLSPLSEAQRRTLTALVDTVVPALPHEDDATGFWACAASALGVDQGVTQYLDTQLPPETRAGLLGLLDALASLGFAHHSQAVRETLLRTVAAISPETAGGVGALRQLTLLFSYGLTDAGGRNPLWPQLRYPGPPGPAPQAPKTIVPLLPEDGAVLEADAVVIGSGSGGGVVAASLAQAGKRVVVLEAGGYFNEADFHGLELNAYQTLYYRGGFHPTADGNVTLVAGANLGGGSTVNWSNSVRPRDDVRRTWAREHGLTDIADPTYDAHIDAVLTRMKVNQACSDENGPHQRLREGAQQLGYTYLQAGLNLDPERYDPDRAGYAGFGDQTGAKQGTLRTFLQDAFDHGAQILVGTQATRILVEAGRAAGVAATVTVGARPRHITVRAPQVVVACGALETPALLLRSGIGGPAAGKNLRLHPAGLLAGVYAEDQRAWWGPPQAGILKQFAAREEGHGFIIEGIQYGAALLASGLPWTGGQAHKALMSKLPRMAVFVTITQDRGSGQVSLDANGNAVHTYALTDDLDARNFRAGIAECARLHAAAGAEEIHALVPGVAPWTRGDDLEAFIAQVNAAPLGAGGQTLFSAHQMGSARMGLDPNTSVADVNGQLHDVPGVWIGDTSAFPTASGVNPMVSCMALAHRTAQRVLAALHGEARAASDEPAPSPAAAPVPSQPPAGGHGQPPAGWAPALPGDAGAGARRDDLPAVTDQSGGVTPL